MDQMMNDPAMLEYLLTQGGLTNEVSDLDRQALLAQGLRERSGTPRGRDTGRTFVAANPLEHLASAIGQGVSNYRDKQIGDSMTGIGTRRQDAMKRLAGTMGGGLPALPGTGSYKALDLADYGGGI